MIFRKALLASAMLASLVGTAHAVTGVTFPATNPDGTPGTRTVSGTTVFGGGASLPAPYLRQAADCWGEKIDLAVRGIAATTPIDDFIFTGTPAFNCATQIVSANNAVSYISTGSGRGILGYFAHTAFYVDPVGQTGDSWLGSGTGPAPAVYATKVNYATSEAGLPQRSSGQGGDIDAYNGRNSTIADPALNPDGAPEGRYVVQSGIVLPIRGADGSAPAAAPPTGTLATVSYPAPRTVYGRAIQIPLLIAVVTTSFDPIYRRNPDGTTVSFRNATASGRVRLSNKQLCYIFNGYATNLAANDVNGASLGLATALGVQTADLPNAASIPIEIVGRSDGSGTTSIFNRHLAAICTANLDGQVNQYNPTNAAVQNAPTSLPANLITSAGPFYRKTGVNRRANLVQPPLRTVNSNTGGVVTNPIPGRFTLADGNDGVAEYLVNNRPNTTGAPVYSFKIGYVGNDFVLPYVNANRQNDFSIVSAALQNGLGAYVAATPSAATKAFGSSSAGTLLLPPQTASSGAFSAGAAGVRANPATGSGSGFWVQNPDTSSPLANPSTSGAYAFVGTTNGLFYQCYADANESGAIKAFLLWYYTNKTSIDASRSILARNGLAPVTKAFQRAIVETFVTNPTYSGVGRLNLDIQQAAVAPQCGGTITGA